MEAEKGEVCPRERVCRAQRTAWVCGTAAEGKIDGKGCEVSDEPVINEAPVRIVRFYYAQMAEINEIAGVAFLTGLLFAGAVAAYFVGATQDRAGYVIAAFLAVAAVLQEAWVCIEDGGIEWRAVPIVWLSSDEFEQETKGS